MKPQENWENLKKSLSKLTKHLNKALELKKEGKTNKEVKKEIELTILHKFFPIFKDLNDGELPSKVTNWDTAIAIGMLRRNEKERYYVKRMRERGQKNLTDFKS